MDQSKIHEMANEWFRSLFDDIPDNDKTLGPVAQTVAGSGATRTRHRSIDWFRPDDTGPNSSQQFTSSSDRTTSCPTSVMRASKSGRTRRRGLLRRRATRGARRRLELSLSVRTTAVGWGGRLPRIMKLGRFIHASEHDHVENAPPQADRPQDQQADDPPPLGVRRAPPSGGPAAVRRPG